MSSVVDNDQQPVRIAVDGNQQFGCTEKVDSPHPALDVAKAIASVVCCQFGVEEGCKEDILRVFGR